MTPRSLIRAPAVAELLDVPIPRIYALAREGRLPAVRLGREVRFDPAALERWIAEGGESLPGGWKREADNDTA